jgi:2'-5' RNA ligase
MNVEQIRSFIAIELPSDVAKALTRHQERLKAGDGRQVKWVEPQNIHLTLQFLGNIAPDAVVGIIHAMEQACTASRHFQLELAGMDRCCPVCRLPPGSR